MNITNIFRRLVGRASLENPSTSLADPDAWAWDMLGARPSGSGVRVNRRTALRFAPWWRGISLVSGGVAKLPLVVYRRIDGGKERDPAHPSYNLLRYKPNAEMTAFTWKETINAHAMSSGNGYAYIVRLGSGAPVELIPLSPDHTWPVRENGRLWYVTQIPTERTQDGVATGGEMRKLRPEDVLHIKGLGFDGLAGYDVVRMAAEPIGLGVAAERYAGRFFANDAQPSVVIEVPGAMKPEATTELRRQWNEMHAGLEKAHRTAVLTQGAKLNPFSINNKWGQLIENREFEIREIANFLNLPPHKLGDRTRTAYKSLEEENQSYLDEGLDPWLVRWEEEVRNKLFTEEEKRGDTHVAEFKRQALVRADLATRASYYTAALGGAPWHTRNEVRALENLNAIEGGDELLDPMNMGSDAPPDGGDDGGDGGSRSEALAQLVTDAVGRAARRLAVHARKASRRPRSFGEWIETYDAAHRDPLVAILGPALRVCGADLAGVDDAVDLLCTMLRGRLTPVYDTTPGDRFAESIDRAVDAFCRDDAEEVVALILGDEPAHRAA